MRGYPSPWVKNGAEALQRQGIQRRPDPSPGPSPAFTFLSPGDDFMSLKEIRKQRNISQKKLVEMLYEDKYIISATTIYRFEHGKSIEQETINRIAKVLKVSVKELY